MAKVFRHLFYGSDSRRSLQEVHRWSEVFLAKYGEATRYVIEADETGLDGALDRLNAILGTVGLFPQPRLVVLKRLTGATKLSAAQRKALDAILKSIEAVPAETTVLTWEERELDAAHPLLAAWQAYQAAGTGLAHRHAVPGERELSAYVKRAGLQLAPEALAWLQRQYRVIGAVQQESRKAAADERGWWLANLLEGASLRAADGEALDIAALQAEAADSLAAANPFALARALAQADFAAAYREAAQFERSADAGAYFGLWGALAWQFRQPGIALPKPTIRLAERGLAQIELVSKAGDLSAAWLLHQLIRRLATGNPAPLLPPRTLWLASLPTA